MCVIAILAFLSGLIFIAISLVLFIHPVSILEIVYCIAVMFLVRDYLEDAVNAKIENASINSMMCIEESLISDR